jgi:hypothetical protein
MSLLAAWVLYPLVLAALCAGLGLLVDALCGRRLPGALVLPAGLAAIVVAGGFTTWSDATAALTVPVLCFGAVLGAGLSLPWRFGRPDPWPAALALGVFFVFGAPAILSGDPTFAGFVKLDDTATWLALTDRIMEHGRSLAGLAPSTYYATLEFNLAGGYPIGAFVPFGAGQKLVGGDLAWVFQPYESFLAAMLSLCLWQILAIVRRPRARALAAFLAAQPALLYGYAMWGGVKELAAAALVALAAALAPGAVGGARRAAVDFDSAVGKPGSTAATAAGRLLLSELRDLLPLALAAAALVGVLSPGGLVWLGPLLLALLVIAWRRFGARPALLRAVAFAALLALLIVPVLATGIVPPTTKPLIGSNGEGNLRGPLSPFQALGVWPSGDFRFHPDGAPVTAVLIALAIGAALLGLWAAWRRRAERPLLYASALLAGAAIAVLGSPWAAGKALATASPIALSLALLGALWALRRDRLAGGLLLAALAGGVLWSNVLAYGGVSLAPYGQLHELQQIGRRFAGQGPALMTEYNPYGARHFLRRLDAEGASELRTRTVPLREGGSAGKGESVDTDRIEPGALFEYRTLVLRRSPLRSRPPAPYRLVWAGRTYEVWQRPEGDTRPPPGFLPLGGSEAAAPRACSAVEALARSARAGGATRLLAARHPPYYNATAGPFEVPRAGRYAAWLGGSVRGSAELALDGRRVGGARQQIDNEGGFVHLGEARLAAGRHEAKLSFGGADLHPGSGGFPRPRTGPLLLAPAGAEAGGLVSVPLGEARRLCGRPWDWIEAVGG